MHKPKVKSNDASSSSKNVWSLSCPLKKSPITLRLTTSSKPKSIGTTKTPVAGLPGSPDRLDTHSQFQRAFTALGVHHRVAPDAQAKGKIERRFLVFQKRLVTLLSFEKISDYTQANHFLKTQIDWHNKNTRCRTPRLTPEQAWQKAHDQKCSKLRPMPAPPLLDLHLAL